MGLKGVAGTAIAGQTYTSPIITGGATFLSGGWRVYNGATTTATEYARGEWVSNVFTISLVTNGGSNRFMNIGSESDTGMSFLVNAATRWGISNSADAYVFYPTTTNAQDVGAAAFRVRTLYLGASVQLLMGTSTASTSIIGAANVNTTAVGNVGAGTDDLITYSLPANAMTTATKGVRITAWGTTANNVNAKTVTLNFGGTAILTNALTASIAGVWRIEADVFSTGASAQDAIAQLVTTGTAGVALNDVEFTTMTETSTGAIVIKCTGTATDNDDIVQQGLLVEFIH